MSELRFAFGENWARFLRKLDDDQIRRSENALIAMTGRSRLDGLSFLDIGSGSGLSSLAARRLGARVHSFDYDADSVACTTEVRARYFPDDPLWTVERGSVLDGGYLQRLGTFDVVYSWGVLHHTGRMWDALESVVSLVKPGGQLFIAIYNDQGWRSRVWRGVKWLYNALPRPLRFLVLWPAAIRIWGPTMVRDLFKLRPFATWRGYRERGMDPWRDVVDWVGGYPFEVASPDEIVGLYRSRGFSPSKIVTCGRGWGCNEFVFTAAP